MEGYIWEKILWCFCKISKSIAPDKFCRTNPLTYDGSTASIREGCCQQISWTSNMFAIKSTSLRGTLYQDIYQDYTDSPWLPIPNKVRWSSHLNCEDTQFINLNYFKTQTFRKILKWKVSVFHILLNSFRYIFFSSYLGLHFLHILSTVPHIHKQCNIHHQSDFL